MLISPQNYSKIGAMEEKPLSRKEKELRIREKCREALNKLFAGELEVVDGCPPVFGEGDNEHLHVSAYTGKTFIRFEFKYGPQDIHKYQLASFVIDYEGFNNTVELNLEISPEDYKKACHLADKGSDHRRREEEEMRVNDLYDAAMGLF